MQTPASEQIHSVSQLTDHIKIQLEDNFSTIWVKGEVSNLRYQSSGHIYFSLKDAGAQISAVMFRGNASKLPFKLQDGMEIVVFGNISVYPPRGTYQLVVRHCIEEGAGRLQAAFEKLKNKLNDEGLFDSSRKKAIPAVPRNIGIVTSPTGAALRDFLSILKRRNWNGNIVLFPAIVQGAEGTESITQNIKMAIEFEKLDLLVIGRGGGSLEDLWNFNEESVVRLVANCPIPIISAVGHEIDFVLTDFAADKRAETPSAAAELITSGYIDVQNRIQQSCQSLTKSVLTYLEKKSLKTQHLSDRLKGVSPQRVLENRYLKLDELDERLVSRTSASIDRKKSVISLMNQRLDSLQPTRQVSIYKDRINQLDEALKKELKHQFRTHKTTIETLEKHFKSLGIEQVLNRGFSITTDHKGRPVKSAQTLKNGQRIRTQLKDGMIESFVDKSEQLDLFS